MAQPTLTCLDMEGVLVPEIWLALADRTGISELRLTTRDIPDYDELMSRRLEVLKQHGVTIGDLQKVVGDLSPLEGAVEFLRWLRMRSQVVVLSDTYYEFVWPLMKQLEYPTIFCHTLEISPDGQIMKYCLRQRDQKRQAVLAFKGLGFRVLAAGDSYNDISMLQEADAGILFRPPEAIEREFPQFPVVRSYEAFQKALIEMGGLVP
ncbi:MAG: bifunctional phosphoserine phosphatase/homoserine phosphotransferase ThrH [Nitrospirae bacterium]|nr:MAG: bifunctional phosphoserine phosphatase/homoserine phosphotransferase ThrH [Nitrospirota bacterium]